MKKLPHQFNMNAIFNRIQQELIKQSDPHTRTTGQNFFREKVKIHGVKTALVTKIAKSFDKEVLAMDKKQIFALCEKLWQSGYMEESFVACRFSYLIRKQYEPVDFKVFEKWVNNYVSNWASCDTFCNHTIGAFVEMYPNFIKNLKKWTKSKNRWVKRASAVSLIVPARKGFFLESVIQIADMLLTDPDDMVQKGYGWLLKVASQSHKIKIFDYVMKNKSIMPRTALRYAIEKMPQALRNEAMKKIS